MSEEIIGNNDLRAYSSGNRDERNREEVRATQQVPGVSVSNNRPRAGALLVEAYGKALPKPRRVAPNKVLVEYARFLVSCVRAIWLLIRLEGR